MPPARCLMVQGTASSVGKTILVAALCRILRQDGYRVAPFKAQNMSLNAAVTVDGGEIGRAQATQAEAAGIPPTVDMNPILLKPESDARCQLVVRGRVVDALSATEYCGRKEVLWPIVVSSLQQLRSQYDVVLIEGAGSPAEVNLRQDDIVNMRVACQAEAPVLLVGDIDRGGVFAALVGTLELLDPLERAMVKGLLINKFRGELGILEPGLRFLEVRTAKPLLGVIPYFRDIALPDEDSVSLEGRTDSRSVSPGVADNAGGNVDVVVIKLPHIANFDDFDPLGHENNVSLRYVSSVAALGSPDLLIIPGTKAALADLAWLKESGLAAAIAALAARRIPIIGICGGFQMLGLAIRDPLGVEGGTTATSRGLELLPLVTTFEPDKITCQVKARPVPSAGLLTPSDSVTLDGYEIHMGRTLPVDTASSPPRPAFEIVERSGEAVSAFDGWVGDDGLVLGTYIHGLFENVSFRRLLLRRVAPFRALAFGPEPPSRGDHHDRLAAHIRSYVDMKRVYDILDLGL